MTQSPDSFAQFLLWERSSRDTLEVKRLYIDMAGDLVAGVVLSQIVYWHLPNREGRPKLQVERKGSLWLAKGRDEWWEECRISPKQADRALEVLEDRGLIEVRLFKFGRAPRKHIRILHDAFLHAWRAEIARLAGGEGSGESADSDFDQRSKSWISTKGQNRLSPKGKNHDFPQRGKSLNTEITTETTAATGSQAEAVPDNAAALVEELVSQGVGRSSAMRFAREKPETCHRCLEYLPYACVKTTKGAWLANAIRDEYGPPPGYEEERARLSREREAESRELARKARQTHELAIREEKAARLGASYQQLEETHGEALAAFNSYVQGERAKIERIAIHLSAERRAELLAAFDRPERRLELFEIWMNSAPTALSHEEMSANAESRVPPGSYEH
jgi:hypothetical protein